MAEPVAWKTLHQGAHSAPVVLAVDFDTTGRPEARFSDLVKNLQTDLPIWETVPLDASDPAATSAEGYLDLWTAPLAAERIPVRALMGFCAGSVYATALAQRVAQWQAEDPVLILIDPELTTPQTLMWQFQKVVGFLSSGLTAEEMEQATQEGRRILATLTEVPALRDALIELMRVAGEPALIRSGLDEARRAELIGVFSSFLHYLSAAGDLDPLDAWTSATALCSSSPLSGLNAMRATGMGPDRLRLGREWNFDVEHATMLADHEVAKAVSRLLES